MNNVLFDVLPTEWNGYELNMDFQVGIQIMCALDDKELSQDERNNTIMYLLFWDYDNQELRDMPQGEEEINQLFSWYLNGWNHDRPSKKKNDVKIIDFNVDQWRIYADFRQIYNINLNNCELHWWEFLGMLWNMPHKLSSLMQVIEMRTRKPGKKASQEEIKTINEAKQIYGLDQPTTEFTSEEKAKIDAYDKMMEELKKKKEIANEALKLM